MNQEHQISIVIPVYNAEKYLAECIDSILSQSFPNFELILVDDGSKDSSGKLCDNYALKDSRIKVIHQINGGVTSARRAGVESAVADWICFVDADDLIPENGLLNLFSKVKEYEQADIIEGKVIRFYPDGKSTINKSIAEGEEDVSLNGHDYALSLCTNKYAGRGPWAKLIRKQLLKESNALDIPRWITNREDVMMLTICAKQIRHYLSIPVPVYKYRRLYGETAVSNKLSWAYWSDYILQMNRILKSGANVTWQDVLNANAVNVFGEIVYSNYIKNGVFPEQFKEQVLPILKMNRKKMRFALKLYLDIFSLPFVLRNPLCIFIHKLYKVKKRLF